MKIINSKNNNFTVFKDNKSGKQIGFAGFVIVYNSKIYVDTRDGSGYDKVITKLKPLVHKFCKKININGNHLEDTKQDIVVHILEGIPKYNPDKNTKLSTFLEMRVGQRLINDLRNQSRISRSATILNIESYKIACKCGATFVRSFSKKDGCSEICKSCGTPLKDGETTPVCLREINGSMVNENSDIDAYFNNAIDESYSIDDDAIFRHDVDKWLDSEDPKIVEIIKLYCFDDHSMSSASNKVGLSGTGGSLKLKRLARKHKVREILGR